MGKHKKIGILTYHRAYNYGAILQAYALEKKIEEYGCECEIIDYYTVKVENNHRCFFYNRDENLRHNIGKFFKDFYRVKKNKNFEIFMKECMNLGSKRYKNFEEMKELDDSDIYDAYIVGSDQVWRYDAIKNDGTFLLAFVKDSKKRNSYAASFGSPPIPSELAMIYQEELSKYHILSVREHSDLEKYNFIYENEGKFALDPTFLLRKPEYESIAFSSILKKPYVFLYTIGKSRRLRAIAKKYCREHNLVLIDSKRSPIFFINSDPRAWLSFMLHAEYIFTNSFHGVAFSIIMQKMFVTEVIGENGVVENHRAWDLMTLLDLEKRDIDYVESKMDDPIDYGRVAVLLEREKKQSIKILEDILEV